MKFSFRFFWLFLLPCLLFVLCSPLTYASENIKVDSEISFFSSSSGFDYVNAQGGLVTYENTGLVENTEGRFYVQKVWSSALGGWTNNNTLQLSANDTLFFQGSCEIPMDGSSPKLLEYPINKGAPFDLTLRYLLDNCVIASFSPNSSVSVVEVVMYNKDRNRYQMVNTGYSVKGNNVYIENIIPEFDVYWFDIRVLFSAVDINYTSSFVPYLTSMGQFMTISELTSDSLLNEVVNNTSETNNKLGNIITQITELPNKIWTVFSDGLKSLFIPDEEAIEEQQDKWNQLLEDRFGALYQTIDMIHDYAETFTEPETQGQIEFPGITVNLAGSDFVFGGQMVDVVPDGFEFLINVVKTIISILATILFVNGMKNRFERLVGGSDNI